jgi:SpoVK/Ycf46/Vps4 family AAA+-type ATPase
LTHDEFVSNLDMLYARACVERRKEVPAREGAAGQACIQVDENTVRTLVKGKKGLIERGAEALEFHDWSQGFDKVGGMEGLKQWLRQRKPAFLPVTSDAAEVVPKTGEKLVPLQGLPVPRGLLLVGHPGSGKSLAAKTVAHEWAVPCVRLSFSSLFTSLVGGAEERLHRALRTIEAVAPAILWLDEVEKGFKGREQALDSGVSMRLFGDLLTWLQERRGRVFLVATANDLASLDLAFLRAGRFDQVVFVGFPEPEDLASIFSIHLELCVLPVLKASLHAWEPPEDWLSAFGRRVCDAVLARRKDTERSVRLTGADIEKLARDAVHVLPLPAVGADAPSGTDVDEFVLRAFEAVALQLVALDEIDGERVEEVEKLKSNYLDAGKTYADPRRGEAGEEATPGKTGRETKKTKSHVNV